MMDIKLGKFITLTRAQAEQAKKEGLTAQQLAANEFKRVHGLDFNPDDFNSEEKFHYLEGQSHDIFRIVYKGGEA